MKNSLSIRLAPWIAVAIFVGLWWAAVRLFGIESYILPTPFEALRAMVQYAGALAGHSATTLYTTVLGFGLAVAFGLGLGIVVGSFRVAYSALYPLLIAFNSVPKAALVPIFVIWFGVGTVPAVVTAFMLSFFPIVVNVATGLATIEPELEDVLKALGASKLDIMRKVGIPRALPYFFGSLKIAITLAFVGSVISESVASNTGIGNLMLQAQAQFQVPLIFAGLIALAVEGIVMYALMAMLEARMTGWAQRSGFAQA